MMKGLENLLSERTMSWDCSARRSHGRAGSSDGLLERGGLVKTKSGATHSGLNGQEAKGIN